MFKENLSRGRFLGVGTKAVVVGLLARLGIRKSEAKIFQRKNRWAMVIDLNRCKGCHACAVACKTEHDVALGVWKCDVKTTEKEFKNETKVDFMPWQCNHCEKPTCIDICPVEKNKDGNRATYQRSDGIVVIDTKRCIGCAKCVHACEYGARYMDPVTLKASKCDLCAHRLDKGLVPSCVNTCPSVVRKMYRINDRNFKKIKKVAKVLSPERGTKPSIYYIGLDQKSFNNGIGSKENRAKERGM